MLKPELSLSDVFEFFKKHNVTTTDQELDEFGGYFIKAATIAAILISPDPLSKLAAFSGGVGLASFRVSKLLSWLPDKFKYKNKGRDSMAIERYEMAGYINFILLQIAIKNGVKEVVIPNLEQIFKDISLTEDEKKELERKCDEFDKDRMQLSVNAYQATSKESISNQALKVFDPIFLILFKNIENCKDTTPALKKLDAAKIKDRYLETVTLQFNAFVIHCATEFPEFAIWADITLKAKILKEIKASAKKISADNRKEHDILVKNVERVAAKIEEFNDRSFIPNTGFPSFLSMYKKLFKIQESILTATKNIRVIENIEAHHIGIKNELIKHLSDNTDVEDIVYPKNKDIYIAQSFEAINYRKKDHRKNFLTADSFGDRADKGENIGNYLLSCLIDPIYITRPIVLLGNPGAGKSMLSKMFAGQLCETNDYVPFLIKLNTVASSSASISEHINKGLANSIENTSDVNWLDWAKEFRNRMPVIIMDGFDELMQTSNRELNGYIELIREFQEKALSSNVCVRIILTSRVTVMQDVSIPDGTKIIKLNSFDDNRRTLWINTWNSYQTKSNYKFAIPNNEKIKLLAKEPLLMFMLAVFDFENSELQQMANDGSFNQSKLYDSLLEKFISRQLEKSDLYKDANLQTKRKEEELFRLRLGMIALMMFMNDTTSRDTQKLHEELIAFGIQKSNIQTENVLGGFFFIHENKSTAESNIEKFNYEFLHKTFGEFLTADFLLRVAKKQIERLFNPSQDVISKKTTFNFCYGYNWLSKHYNILNFLFEHGKTIIKPETNEHRMIIGSIIKNDIKELFDTGHQAFPDVDIRLMEKKAVIEHLGIYSQNLIFLWLAISKPNEDVIFEIFDPADNVSAPVNEAKYESQDRDEINKNKLHWKRIAKLWTLIGNYSAAAKLNEWIKVVENPEHVTLKWNRSEIVHNFSDAAIVACDDFELLLSYFDTELKFSDEHKSLQRIKQILVKKPEMSGLALDAVLHRFSEFLRGSGSDLLTWLIESNLNRRQQVLLLKKIGLAKSEIEPHKLVEIFNILFDKGNRLFEDNSLAALEYVKLIAEFKSYYTFSPMINGDRLESLFHHIVRDGRMFSSEYPVAMMELLKVLNEISKNSPISLRLRVDFLEEGIYHISKNFDRYISEDIYTCLECLRIINDLKAHFPVGKKILNRIVNELMQRLPHELERIQLENPSAVLEYVKLINNLSLDFRLKAFDTGQIIQRSIENLLKGSREVFRRSRYNFYEFVRVIAEFNNLIPLREFLTKNFAEEILDILTKEIIELIHLDSKKGHLYVALFKELLAIGPFNKAIERSLADVYQHSEVEYIFRSGNSEVLINLLELFLVISPELNNNNTGQRLLGEIISLKSSSRKDKKIALLQTASVLIKNRAPLNLIEELLKTLPDVYTLYQISPALTGDLIRANIEILSYEGTI